MAEVRMIVGLGNPGSEYTGTRHNAGFEAIDILADRLGTGVKKKKFGACFGETVFSGKKLILLKPQLFMNNSGEPVAAAAAFYGLEPDSLLVITDDMALEPGRIRIRAQGSSGGHKGLEDIIEKLGTDRFGRLRIGIGLPDRQTAEDFVLARPPEEERKLIADATQKANEAALCWAEYGTETAMNRFNSE